MTAALALHEQDRGGLAQLTVVRNPVAGDIERHWVTARMTLAEVIATVPDLPAVFLRHGTVTLSQLQPDGTDKFSAVPRRYWADGQASLKLWVTGTVERPVRITLHAPALGGGGSKGKNVLGIVASLALAAVAFSITGGAAAGILPGLFNAGTFSARALALATTFVGRLAISMASRAAAKPKKADANAPEIGQAGASGNTLEPGGAGYRVAGILKVAPPLACFPLIDLRGNDEYVEACYTLAGPHEISDLKAEGTPFDEIADLQYYADDGTSARPSRLLQRFGKQTQPGHELKAHKRSDTQPTRLYHQATPELSLPEPHVETTALDPDEIWFEQLWPAGMTKTSAPVLCLMSLRFSMAIAGTSDYINLPELMFASQIAGRVAKTVKLTWADPITPLDRTRYQNGAYASYHTVPAQTVAPAGTGGWNADASFINSAAISDCARVEHREDGFTVYLDPAVFPRGHRWKIKQMRSCVTRFTPFAAGASTVFDPATYSPVSSSVVYDLFGYFLISGVAYTANGNTFYASDVSEACVLLRFASVFNRPPLPLAGDAAIEVIGKNINVTQVTCKAGAIVGRWDGTGFNDMGPSSSPADHFYHVLTSIDHTAQPVPDRKVDVAELAEWRADCLARNLTVAAVFNGTEWRETLNAIAGAGLARLREGRRFGVVRQRDTFGLGVASEQLFTPRNAAGFRVTKSFDDVPDGVLVSFRNKELDWDNDEILVLRPGVTAASAARIISLNAVAIDDPAQIVLFFTLYLAAAWYRDHLIAFTSHFGALKAREGDIVSVNHLMLDGVMASARICAVTRNGTDQITDVTLDAVPPTTGTPDLTLETALEGLADVIRAGSGLGASIYDGAGQVTTHAVAAVNARARRITFALPFVNDHVASEHVVAMGRLGAEELRCEITKIEPRADCRFDITCAPEAPAMWTEL